MNGRWLSGIVRVTSLAMLLAGSTATSAADTSKHTGQKQGEPSSQKSSQESSQKEAHTPSQDQGEPQSQNASEASSQKSAPSSSRQKPKSSFGYEDVVARARVLASEPYTPRNKIPAFLRESGSVAWKTIQFKPKYALWQGARIPFEVRFYHPGSYFVYPVTVHAVSDCGARVLHFSPQQFDYPSPKVRKKIPENLGYAGIKIMHHLNSSEYLDEVVSFLGASYFRALPEGAHYGASARGLAINTATSSGEEFPAFTHFWLVQPESGDQTLTLYALLDSPSVAGAYKFVIDPGQTTVMQVEATLFTRTAIKKLGIAPLTSMFAWGENSMHRGHHARPEAHDSDGLLIHFGSGEWLWRPLKNPQQLTVNQFVAESIQGFGLLQRDRNFFHYQHLEYEYEDRPSVWVVPKGDWGPGAVELVQIPSNSEVNDNIIVYWVPDDPVKANERLHFAYTLKWMMHDPSSHGRATTRATRIGYATVNPEQKKEFIKIAIEFDGGKLGKPTDLQEVTAHITPMREVNLHKIQAVRNPHTNGVRLSFLVPTSALDKPLDLRAFLSGAKGQPLTETWTYTLAQ